MIPSNKKIERMIQIARLYYEEDMTQHLIAQKLGISRPLVSQLLTEAKSCGIVSIRINEVENREALLRHQLLDRFRLSAAVVVPDDTTPEETDRAVASAVYQHCFLPDTTGKNVGLGCGPALGLMAELAEGMPTRPRHNGHIFPLIGGLTDTARGSHTNELVRILSGKAGFQASCLYAPALLSSHEELDAMRQMGPCLSVTQYWDHMDMAEISIENFPTNQYSAQAFQPVSDQYGPVGQILAHSYTVQGAQIPLKEENVLQASMDQLRDAGQVVAVCSAGLDPAAIQGALELDLVHTLILPVSLAQQLLNN